MSGTPSWHKSSCSDGPHNCVEVAEGEGDLAAWLSYDTTDQTQLRAVTDVHDGDRVERQLSNTALGVTNIASGGERTSFVRDPNGELISMVAWEGDERFHYTLDHQNTVLAVTAEGSEADAPDAVYAYSPYGEQSSDILDGTRAAELNPFGYTGAYQFQDGTVHLSHRFLDTFTLNFTQPDPSRQELNNHTYAAYDPINRVNPTGLFGLPPCATAWLGVREPRWLEKNASKWVIAASAFVAPLVMIEGFASIGHKSGTGEKKAKVENVAIVLADPVVAMCVYFYFS